MSEGNGHGDDGKADDRHYSAPTHETIRALVRAGNAAMSVWLALSVFADWVTGVCSVSYDTLKREFGLSRGVISSGIRQLLDLGLLEMRRRFSASNVYVLKGFRPKETSSLKSGPQSPRIKTTGTPVPLNQDSSPLKSGPQSSQNPDANDHLLTTSLNKGGAPPSSSPSAETPDRPPTPAQREPERVTGRPEDIARDYCQIDQTMKIPKAKTFIDRVIAEGLDPIRLHQLVLETAKSSALFDIFKAIRAEKQKASKPRSGPTRENQSTDRPLVLAEPRDLVQARQDQEWARQDEYVASLPTPERERWEAEARELAKENKIKVGVPIFITGQLRLRAQRELEKRAVPE